MTIRLFVAFLALIVVTPYVNARDLIVDNLRGNDSQNDRGLLAGTPTYGPYKTINRALLAAQPGDRIIIKNTGKPYRECISLVGTQHSGTTLVPFEIIGNGATLDGSYATSFMDWENVKGDIWELGKTPPGYGLLTSGSTLVSYKPVTEGTSLTTLAPQSWTRIGAKIYFRGDGLLGPADFSLEVCDQTTGITLYDVEHVIISDLVVRGYRIDGINAHDRVDQVRLVNITSTLNGRSGVTVAGASSVGVVNSKLELNGKAQLRVEARGIAYTDKLTLSDELGVKSLTEDKGQIIPLQTNL